MAVDETKPVLIDVVGASKSYRLYREKATSLKERITKVRGDRYDLLWAVKDLSLTVREGEVLGLVGHNGSGKSTLLRMMAGIQKPNEGSVAINGRVSALLELGAGFHPDLTGRENIYLNASILGMRRAEIDKVFDDIVEFAGGQIPEFIDVPVKIYSSGMFVRLGFSVAVHLSPQILIIDEVIAVGDEEFQRRCFEYLYELRSKGVTIVMVTHGLALVSNMCDRAVWLDHGVAQMEGPAPDVVQAYVNQVNKNEEHRHELARTAAGGDPAATVAAADPSAAMRVEGVELIDDHGTPLTTVVSGAPTRLRIHYAADQPVIGASFGVGIRHETGLTLARTATAPGDVHRYEGTGHIDLDIPSLPLAAGEFSVDVDLFDAHHMVRFDHREGALVLHVQPGSELVEGIVDLGGKWSPPAGS